MKFAEPDIQKALSLLFGNYEYRLQNAFVFENESDWFGLSKSTHYAYEVEVKITKSDFKADFKKPRHKKYTEYFSKKEGFCPNCFYYAVPERMISVGDVPEYAGLIYVNKTGNSYVVKRAPYIHRNKLNLDRILKEKFYHRYLEYKHKFVMIEREAINLLANNHELNKELKRYKKPKAPKNNWRQFEMKLPDVNNN